MSMTERDKKIIFAIIPLLLLGAYWFFLLAPKREEASKADSVLSQAQGRRTNAEAQVKQLNGAKASFANDYATVIRLGKTVPATVDMPSLIVQLDRAARGTGIKFQNVKTGQRTTAAAAAPTPAAQPPSSKPAQPGAPPAQSGPGRAAQAAGGAVQASNNSSAAAGASAGNQQAPAAPGAAGSAPGGGAATQAAALESIPLEFTFKGDFFNLADFFHRMKRFVRVANDRIVVRGRLITIDSFNFKSGSTFPKLTAEVKATVYLAPKAEGVSAGASPQGPAGAGAPGAPPQAASTSPTPPAAAVTR